MLKYQQQKVVSVSDWDRLVCETYGRIYSLQQQDGCQERKRVRIRVPDDDYDFKNDTVPEIVNHDDMGVSFKAWLARDPEKKIPSDGGCDFTAMWWQRNFYPDLQTVANDLHAKGMIEAGEYYIDIDW